MDRWAAYRWLAEELGITAKECHIGQFEVDLCQVVIVLAARKLRELRA